MQLSFIDDFPDFGLLDLQNFFRKIPAHNDLVAVVRLTFCQSD